MAVTTYYIFSSIDGFVAGADNSLDWLYELDPADRDFTPFLDQVGALAMGASTYESVLADSQLLEHPERWRDAHRGRPAWVFTHRELPKVPGADIRFVSGDVRAVHADLVRAAGERHVFISGGGGLATAFGDAGLLDRIVVGVAPVMLGGGKPLYTGSLPSSRLSLVSVERAGQLACLTYDVRPA